MEANEFRVAAKQLVDYIADYLENIRDRSVLPSVQPGYMRNLIPDLPPEEGEKWSHIFDDIEKVIMPGVSHLFNFHIIFTLFFKKRKMKNIQKVLFSFNNFINEALI
jgi:hypothetical protein